MRCSQRSVFLCFLVAACGGGSEVTPDSSAPIDAPVVLVDAPADAPGCLPVVPSSTVSPAAGPIAPSFVSKAIVTSSGEVGILAYDGANGQTMLTWDGTAWGSHSVYTNTNGQFGQVEVSEFDGRPVVLANVIDQTSDTGKLRFWLQLDTGGFAIGQRVDPGATTTDAPHARYSKTSSLLSVAGGDQSKSLYSYERNAAGTWTTQLIDFISSSGLLRAAGVGKLADGTAVVAAAGTSGFNLYRRTGTTWAFYKSLASGTVSAAEIEFPPEGSAGTSAVAIYIDPMTSHMRGELVSLATGTPGASADLLPMTNLSATSSQIVFEPDGTKGKILIADGNFSNPRAWIVSFQGTSFTAAQELRPDRVFDAYPQLLYHPCGGYMVLHASRAPSDPETEAILLERLTTFAPGL